ncbi:MAG: class II aldolase/adducin family protein [Gemmatimonadota bacterium]|nr:MAG: class II aldolase/adducin family protein [Gemmatimonadota bacterium]
MSVLSPWIGGTRRLVGHVGQSGLLFGPIRRAIVEPAATAHDEALRLLLCYHGKRAWQAGLIAGCCGNLSARLHNRDAIYITPRAANKSRLHASDIQVVDLYAGAEGLESVSVELPLHRACYLADSMVGAVIHTHAPALTALGIRGLDLSEILPEAAASLGRLARVPYAPAGSAELAEAVGQAVAYGALLLLLEHHGAVTVGNTLGEAYERMEFGELSAKAALMATADRGFAAARIATSAAGPARPSG